MILWFLSVGVPHELLPWGFGKSLPPWLKRSWRAEALKAKKTVHWGSPNKTSNKANYENNLLEAFGCTSCFTHCSGGPKVVGCNVRANGSRARYPAPPRSAAMGHVLASACWRSWSSLALGRQGRLFLQTKIFVKMVTLVLNYNFLWIDNFIVILEESFNKFSPVITVNHLWDVGYLAILAQHFKAERNPLNESLSTVTRDY